MRKNIILGIIFLLAVFYLLMAIFAEPIPSHPFFNDSGIRVIAHRGGSGLWPENTLYAFKKSVEAGVDVLEMDVRRSSDSALVVIHDENLERTTNGKGAVKNQALSELKKLDAGYHWTKDKGETYPYRNREIAIPSLEEVFKAFPDTRMSVEIKEEDAGAADSLCRSIREHDMTDRVLVGSFHDKVLKEFRKGCPEVATSAGEKEVTLFYFLSLSRMVFIYTPSAEALQIPKSSNGTRLASRKFFLGAHKRNMEVHVWTLNEKEDMQRILNMGADGIVTDYPDRLLSLLGRENETASEP